MFEHAVMINSPIFGIAASADKIAEKVAITPKEESVLSAAIQRSIGIRCLLSLEE